MQPEQKAQRVQERFRQQTGLDMAMVLAPIDQERPAGVSLREDDIYSRIAEARREDDATLPQGVWEHELKKADWDEVASTSLEALRTMSKDLQLAIWLLEAHVHRFGFAGIAPCMVLISQLCSRYWDNLYPRMIDGDSDYRTNLIAWINNKLQPALRLLPITSLDDTEADYCWADWEMAQRRETYMATHPNQNDGKLDVLTTQQIRRAFIGTSNEFYLQLAEDLEQGISTTDELMAVIDEHCGLDAPSLSGFRGVLEEIQDMVRDQMDQRGIVPVADSPVDEVVCDETLVAAPAPASRNSNVIADRVDAYAHLRQVAEFLAVDDPHSPVPYLIMKAVEWGGLNTAELYHELFVEQQGQLNIFDVLGLQQNSPANGGNHHANEE